MSSGNSRFSRDKKCVVTLHLDDDTPVFVTVRYNGQEVTFPCQAYKTVREMVEDADRFCMERGITTIIRKEQQLTPKEKIVEAITDAIFEDEDFCRRLVADRQAIIEAESN
jgi:hypothetical protein